MPAHVRAAALGVREVEVKISSVKVERRGGHEHVTVFIDGKNVGTLTVGLGEAAELLDLWNLIGATVTFSSSGASPAGTRR